MQEVPENRVENGTRDSRGRILVVDDDRDFCEALSDLLEVAGFEARAAGSCEKALAELGEFEAQVALVDLRLGREEGLDLLPRIKARGVEIECVIMTAYADLDTAIEAVRRGAYDYLRKPLDERRLFLVLDRAIEKGKLERHLRQRQRLEVVGSLAGGVAHDINNILTVVQGNSELMRRGLEDGLIRPEELRRRLDEIDRAAARAAALTRRLLLFSRGQRTSPEVVDLNSLLQQSRAMLSRLLRESIQLEFRAEENLAKIHADPSQIEQVIVNLAVNASDAMPRGGRLVFETKNCPAGDGVEGADEACPRVLLLVQDTGCGMDAPTLERIFEPFFTTKALDRGTGLGLSTVFGIIEGAGGEIQVESAVGRGSTFRIYLPAHEEAGGSAQPALERGAEGAQYARGGGERILLCEDDSSVRRLVAAALKGAGYQVESAADGERALALAAGAIEPFALLVTDVLMPGIDGVELARRLRSARADLPVLFVSGYAPSGFDGGAAGEESTELLRKPFDVRVLLEMVRSLLNLRIP